MDDKIKKEVRTYTDDMVQVIEDSGGTLVKKIIKEEEAKEAEKRNPAKRADRAYGLAGSVLLLLGVGVIFFLSINREPPRAPTAATPRVESEILLTDTSTEAEI